MNHIQGLHPQSFHIASKESDFLYYTTKKVPSLMDTGAYKVVEALYHTFIPKSDIIVDLMCGNDSHLPKDTECNALIGIDINPKSLHQNKNLTQGLVADVNYDGQLPLKEDSIDIFCMCAVFEYLRKPVSTLKECFRSLKPGGKIIIAYSTFFLPQRATALWQALDNNDRQRLIKTVISQVGFINIDQGEVHPNTTHPLWKQSVYSIVAQKL